MSIKRNEIVNLIAEAIDKSEILDYIKKDKNFEKRVKEIASDVVTELFRVLWQHNSLVKYLGK